MKTIFVATDFSSASHNAFLYSLELAKAFGARVVLFHAFQASMSAYLEPTVVNTPEEIKMLVKDRLTQHLRALNDKDYIPIDLICEEGLSSPTILQAAATHGADLIISGMKHHGKTFRRFFGSTVTSLARHTSIPMIVVPEEAHYQAPSTIALASDMAPDTDMHTLDALVSIGERFQSKVYIVRVISDRFEEVYELLYHPVRFSRLSGVLETHYEYTHHKDVAEALRFFIQTSHIQLVALIPHQHNLLEKWFFKSKTQKMIFKSDIPLLILPERAVTYDAAGEHQVTTS